LPNLNGCLAVSQAEKNETNTVFWLCRKVVVLSNKQIRQLETCFYLNIDFQNSYILNRQLDELKNLGPLFLNCLIIGTILVNI
jgi:hypothetical protein